MNCPLECKGIVILAHTPPPLHGQSLMVSVMLDALRRDANALPPIFHVDCRYSESLRAMGSVQISKIFLAVRYALQTLLLRFRHGADTIYYIPAPGKRPAFLRDCVILSLIRPFFRRTVFHWHAAGLSSWLEEEAIAAERWMGRKIYDHSSVSIVLGEEKKTEVASFDPEQIVVVPNGIPDPCPTFERSVLPDRLDRAALFDQFSCSTGCLRLLYLSAASREKGVFTALQVWRELNTLAVTGEAPFCRLTVAGGFADPTEEAEFERLRSDATTWAEKHLRHPEARIEMLGWVEGFDKTKAYAAADVFIFPSTYPCESFGLVLVEAASHGLPCVTYQPLVGVHGLSPEFHRRVAFGQPDAMTQGVREVIPLLKNASAIRADARLKFNPDLFGARLTRTLFPERVSSFEK